MVTMSQKEFQPPAQAVRVEKNNKEMAGLKLSWSQSKRK
jgi:hypothetical protein